MEVEYKVRPNISSDQLNSLLEKVWQDHKASDLSNVLLHSLTYIGAYRLGELVGFVNVAWDGGEHAFLLDTAVIHELRRRGIGTRIVEHAVADVRSRGLKWLHVDFEPQLEEFYRGCGFRFTAAGLIKL